MKILFICSSNVGRSQMAESIFNQLSGKKHIANSAGISVNKNGIIRDGQTLEEKGVGDIIFVLKEIGIDASQNKRTQLTPKIAEIADKIISLEKEETLPEYVNKSNKVSYWEIENQTGKSIESVRLTRDRITDLVKELLTEIK